jgi:hypothetical protein
METANMSTITLPTIPYGMPTPAEIWCAYNSDGSSFCIFPTEVEALRHALAYTMSGVKKVTWGDLQEQVRA